MKLLITPDAKKDLDNAVEYYTEISEELGLAFLSIIDRYFKLIADYPTSSSIRYDEIRVRPIETFPFTIHYTITEANVLIVRIFNTYQKPVY